MALYRNNNNQTVFSLSAYEGENVKAYRFLLPGRAELITRLNAPLPTALSLLILGLVIFWILSNPNDPILQHAALVVPAGLLSMLFFALFILSFTLAFRRGLKLDHDSFAQGRFMLNKPLSIRSYIIPCCALATLMLIIAQDTLLKNPTLQITPQTLNLPHLSIYLVAAGTQAYLLTQLIRCILHRPSVKKSHSI